MKPRVYGILGILAVLAVGAALLKGARYSLLGTIAWASASSGVCDIMAHPRTRRLCVQYQVVLKTIYLEKVLSIMHHAMPSYRTVNWVLKYQLVLRKYL